MSLCHILVILIIFFKLIFQFSSVQLLSHSLRPHGLLHARLPCPSTTPGACSNSCVLSRWCHPTISSSVIPFSSHLQSFPASGSFLMSQVFTSGGQSIGVSASASVLSMNIQDWFPLGWTDWISLQSKGLLRIFPNTTVQKYQFFAAYYSIIAYNVVSCNIFLNFSLSSSLWWSVIRDLWCQYYDLLKAQMMVSIF